MALLDDVKDQFRERGQAIWERVQESSLYNNFIEKFEAWPPWAQKTLVGGVSFACVLFLFYIPYSFLDSASQHIADFNERRETIRQLLKAGRSRGMGGAASGPNLQTLRQQIDITGKAANLIPEQFGPIQEADSADTQNLAPKALQQVAVTAKYKKLNLRQIVDLGFDLDRIHPSAKVLSTEITASPGLKNYYDVTYKVVSFVIPGAGKAEAADAGDEE